MWTIGVLQREKVPGIDVLVEVMVAVVEETPVPTFGEDTIPKGNIVPDPLKDEADGLVEAPGGAGMDTPRVDEMGWEKGGGVELTIAIDVELDIIGVVSIGLIKM